MFKYTIEDYKDGEHKTEKLGSPTINQDAVKSVWGALSQVCAVTNRGKAAGAVGSYGCSCEGVQMMNGRL